MFEIMNLISFQSLSSLSFNSSRVTLAPKQLSYTASPG